MSNEAATRKEKKKRRKRDKEDKVKEDLGNDEENFSTIKPEDIPEGLESQNKYLMRRFLHYLTVLSKVANFVGFTFLLLLH